MGWADKVRKLKVRANADTPNDARVALKFGTEGIGLCRTEHMFFDADRILAVREMILADDEKGRRAALAKLLPMQRGDFTELFEIMKGLPVTIRLLDPPLHEFLPHTEEEIAEVAEAMKTEPRKLKERAAELAEFNPMLGFRGCRLAIAYPEIAEMQARAIFEAAVEAGKRTGAPVVPEVMVPLIATKMEFDLVKARIDAMAEAVAKETGTKIDYQVGTMIELPRACLKAGEIAETAEFFSFGTNDLTQTTFGISRDDAASFLGTYQRKGHPADRSVRLARSRGRRRTDPHRDRARAQGAQRPQARHLRRAWRRSGLGRVLPRGRARLRVVLAVPRADRAARRRAGRARQGRGQHGLINQATPPSPRNVSTSSRRLRERLVDRARRVEHGLGRLARLHRRARDLAEHVHDPAGALGGARHAVGDLRGRGLLLVDRDRHRGGRAIDLAHALGDALDRRDRRAGRILHREDLRRNILGRLGGLHRERLHLRGDDREAAARPRRRARPRSWR